MFSGIHRPEGGGRLLWSVCSYCLLHAEARWKNYHSAGGCCAERRKLCLGTLFHTNMVGHVHSKNSIKQSSSKSKIPICLRGLYNLYITTPSTFRPSNQVSGEEEIKKPRQGKRTSGRTTEERSLSLERVDGK